MSLEVTSVNFEQEVLQSQVPVLVDFWAEWCGPCRMMSPIIDEIGQEADQAVLKVVKINVDQAQEIAQNYNVMSIPAFKLFKNGQVVAEFVGSRPKDGVLDMLRPHLE